MAEQQIEGVGRTAIGVARVRAAESARADRLFDDPYASAFVRAAAAGQPQAPAPDAPSRTGRVMAEGVVLRTRFFDEYLTGAANGGCRQVVLLAAGLDTRAFRLAWPPGTRLFELDLPEVLAFKERVLREERAVPACERTVLPVDLRGEWAAALAAAGFDPAERTAWLAEGLLVYLSAGEAAALLTAVGEASAPGSLLSLTHGQDLNRLVRQTRTGDEFRSVSDLWRGGLDEPADGWLRRHGWATTAHDKNVLGDAYGRPQPPERGGSFLVAERLPSGSAESTGPERTG